jgi:hypothetical protein
MFGQTTFYSGLCSQRYFMHTFDDCIEEVSQQIFHQGLQPVMIYEVTGFK